MQKLLTVNEFKSAKSIVKVNEFTANQAISTAQAIDVKDLLGSRFYFDLISNSEQENYQDLLSGCTFSFMGVDYYQEGIKALLSDYVMARYIIDVATNLTPFGTTVKHSDDSEPSEFGANKDKSNTQTQLAGIKWEIIKLYLDSNTTKYPFWLNNIYDTTESIQSERVFKLRRI